MFKALKDNLKSKIFFKKNPKYSKKKKKNYYVFKNLPTNSQLFGKKNPKVILLKILEKVMFKALKDILKSKIFLKIFRLGF